MTPPHLSTLYRAMPAAFVATVAIAILAAKMGVM